MSAMATPARADELAEMRDRTLRRVLVQPGAERRVPPGSPCAGWPARPAGSGCRAAARRARRNGSPRGSGSPGPRGRSTAPLSSNPLGSRRWPRPPVGGVTAPSVAVCHTHFSDGGDAAPKSGAWRAVRRTGATVRRSNAVTSAPAPLNCRKACSHNGLGPSRGAEVKQVATARGERGLAQPGRATTDRVGGSLLSMPEQGVLTSWHQGRTVQRYGKSTSVMSLQDVAIKETPSIADPAPAGAGGLRPDDVPALGLQRRLDQGDRRLPGLRLGLRRGRPAPGRHVGVPQPQRLRRHRLLHLRRLLDRRRRLLLLVVPEFKPTALELSNDLGWISVAFVIFNTYMLLWSLFVNRAVFSVFLTLEITFILLAIGNFSNQHQHRQGRWHRRHRHRRRSPGTPRRPGSSTAWRPSRSSRSASR